MEFNFRLADIFPTEISIVGSDLIPKGSPGVVKIGQPIVKQRIGEIMDVVGKASAVAQTLHTVITSSEKLRSGGDEQLVYFLCDFNTNEVVGLLKIGRRKLFVYDQQGVQHELTPLCILDFYVHESRQRVGCGKVLFDAMLANENVDVKHLAIDRPSDKFIYFLRKHYQLTKMIPQINNFAIFDGFFSQRSDYAGKKPRWGGLDQPAERPTRQNLLNKTEFQDSRSYNKEPPLHLRNLQGGLPGYIPQRHASSIGDVLQPPMRGGSNGFSNSNGHTLTNGNGSAMRRLILLERKARSHHDLSFYSSDHLR